MNDEMFAKLDRFHGKPELVKITDDTGEIQEFSIAQLPVKHLPMVLKLQAYKDKYMVKTEKRVENKKTRRLETVVDETMDYSKMSETEIDIVMGLTKDMIVKSIAYSLASDKQNDEEISKIEKMVDTWGVAYLEKFSDAVMKVNAMTEGDSKKS